MRPKIIIEATKLLNEVSRLRMIIEAIESPQPDSYFSESQNRHRRNAIAAQNAAFGSREELRELLSISRTALQYYATGDDPDRARIALAFIESEETDMRPLSAEVFKARLKALGVAESPPF